MIHPRLHTSQEGATGRGASVHFLLCCSTREQWKDTCEIHLWEPQMVPVQRKKITWIACIHLGHTYTTNYPVFIWNSSWNPSGHMEKRNNLICQNTMLHTWACYQTLQTEGTPYFTILRWSDQTQCLQRRGHVTSPKAESVGPTQPSLRATYQGNVSSMFPQPGHLLYAVPKHHDYVVPTMLVSLT